MQSKGSFMKRLNRQWELVIMIVPIMIYVFIFSYLPLKGWTMAFQNYKPGLKTQQWVGFKQFAFLFQSPDFYHIMRNTLAMSALNLILGTFFAIFVALMINEVGQKLFKRIVQTISYLPYFLSWVIAAALVADFLSSTGTLNTILMGLHLEKEANIFMGNAAYSWWIVAWTNVWKSTGWNTIIYLAAITSIDPELYESAELDGAGRFARMLHITIPGIKSTILVLVIMNIGWILNAGFELQYLLINGLIQDTMQTIDVYVIRYGIAQRNFSLATALGIFKTVVSIVLLTGANQISKRFAGESLV